MVVIHCKRGDKENEFLCELKTTQSVDDVKKDLVELHNMRIKVQRTAVYRKKSVKSGGTPYKHRSARSHSTLFGIAYNRTAIAYPSNIGHLTGPSVSWASTGLCGRRKLGE